jgi:hypothetical protein
MNQKFFASRVANLVNALASKPSLACARDGAKAKNPSALFGAWLQSGQLHSKLLNRFPQLLQTFIPCFQ